MEVVWAAACLTVECHAGAKRASKRMSQQAALQAQATAAADAGGQAAIAAASAGRKAAALQMKQKRAQLAPIKGSHPSSLVFAACS